MVNGALASKQLVLSSWCLCVIQGQRFGVSFFLIQLQRSVKHRLPATVTASNDDGCLAETERLMACWHDAGRWAMPAMPLRSCPAECEARCMDLPRGLMCFHLRYMLFFVFFALESLNCKKDCERSWKMWNLPGKYKVCFFCARFSVVMLPLAARFRVQKCGHDILQGPSSFVVETFCMKVFMKNCPFPTRRHLQLQLQLHRWALLVVGSPIISWIREALTLQANGKFTSQLGSLIEHHRRKTFQKQLFFLVFGIWNKRPPPGGSSPASKPRAPSEKRCSRDKHWVIHGESMVIAFVKMDFCRVFVVFMLI